RLLAFHDRIVLVGRALDGQLATRLDQPRPSAAEPAGARLVELFLESVETAEGRGDGLANRAGRRATLTRPHDLPEHRVIDVSAAVVAHGRTDVVGHRREILDEFLGALALERGVLLECGVEVVDVRRMMLAVMDLHRLSIDVRLESGEIVRQRW